MKSACLLVIALFATSACAAERPNIVLMMADDLGWGDVGFNGNQVIQTPSLNQMAESGLKFTRFYSAAPVCSPTRGSCLTGRHPYRYGIYSANVGHMKPEELTLAELLKKLGYRTGHFGKWHLGTLTKTVNDANRGGPRGAAHYSPPQVNGFDVCFSTESKVPTWDPLLQPQGNKSRTWWDAVTEGQATAAYGTRYWNERGEEVQENTRGDDSRVIMDRAIPFINAAVEKKDPFFVVIWFHAPHLPVVAGPKYAARYAECGKYEQNFYGCVTALDEQVGRLRAELRKLGVADNTLVTFASDNGPEGKAGKAPGTAGPFRGRKRDLYEGGVRVPAVIEWPGRIKPGETAFPAVTSDYLKTILEIVGVEYPNPRPLDGMSLLPVFSGELKARPRPIGFQSARQVALSDNQYKVIATSVDPKADTLAPGAFELYDLLADPGETKNLAAEHPDIIRRMVDIVNPWRASCRASDAGRDYHP